MTGPCCKRCTDGKSCVEKKLKVVMSENKENERPVPLTYTEEEIESIMDAGATLMDFAMAKRDELQKQDPVQPRPLEIPDLVEIYKLARLMKHHKS